ncbi:MAG: DivIVA domain-containing protein [Bacilli bacterium]|nr:DivIVA domain-containing protein [Bacilli bacterium]
MKRFTIKENGYDIEEVNKFVDIVIRKLEMLNNENITYKNKISSLEKKLEDVGSIDKKLSNAILAADDAAEQMKRLAKAESTMMIEDAKRNANAIIHEALIEAEKTQNEAATLRKNIIVYKNRVTSLLKAQLEIADELDSIKLE